MSEASLAIFCSSLVRKSTSLSFSDLGRMALPTAYFGSRCLCAAAASHAFHSRAAACFCPAQLHPVEDEVVVCFVPAVPAGGAEPPQAPSHLPATLTSTINPPTTTATNRLITFAPSSSATLRGLPAHDRREPGCNRQDYTTRE
jgi:hypothetical protein